MAIKTQLRLNQMTASFGVAVGQINDGGFDLANKAALADIPDVDLSGSLSYLASSIRRIHGGSSFSDQGAGDFSQDLTIKPSGAATLTVGGASANDHKVLFDGNAVDFHAGLKDSDDRFYIGLGSALGTTFNLQLESTNRDVTCGGDFIVGGGDLKLMGDGKILDDSAHERIVFTDAGDLQLKDADGTQVLTVHASDLSVDVAGDLVASTLQADGDTAAGDNAAIGYTAAEGIIITGQGSTSDITIKNDADAVVLDVATGTTNVVVHGDLLAGTLQADGDTAAGDAAAIGYTASEGIIITGQGSTNDVTIKNDNDTLVMDVPTGTTTVNFAGAVNAQSMDVVGDLVAGNLQADGDTAAGDAAAIGYTAAEGIIITGQGSTNDVTIKNDADADVLVVPTGTTNVDIVGVATAATFEPDGDTAAGDNAAIGYTAAEGIIITGQGSTSDVTIKNDADATVLEIKTGTTQVDLAGNLLVGGNIIKAADGGSTLTLANDDKVTFAGNLDHANSNWDIGASITSPSNSIILGGGCGVEVLGDLYVRGTEHIIDTDNLRIKDPVIAMGAGNKTANSNGGIAIISGSTSTLDMVMGRVANNTWGSGIMDTQSGSITSLTGMTLARHRASRYEIDGTTNYLDVSTDLQVVAAADIELATGVGGSLKPSANDGVALGEPAVAFSDLYLGSGAKTGWANGDIVWTHSAGKLTLSGDGAVELDFGNHELTNVDIDSGAMDGVIIGAVSAQAGTFAAIAGTTGTYSGILKTDDTTDASSKTDGSLQTDGGLSVAKKAYVGTGLTVEAGGATVTAGGVTVTAGRVTVDDTTEATSATDGSLQTDGGLSVAKSAVVGADLDLLSNGAIFKVGVAEPFTLTHSNANNTLLASANHRLAFGSADEYIMGDGNDLNIESGRDLFISAAGNDIEFGGSGAESFAALTRAGAGEAYVNFSTNDGSSIATGNSGFGFKNNGGTMQFKNSGGSWANFGGSASASKVSQLCSSSISAGTRVFGGAGGFDFASVEGSEDNMIDVYVNGQMMLSGGTAASITNDYAVDISPHGPAAADLRFNFDLADDDVVTVLVR